MDSEIAGAGMMRGKEIEIWKIGHRRKMNGLLMNADERG
jgi:hypothetical protein